MILPDPDATVPDSIESAHFIGVGGAGMSGIARLFLESGVRVTGSDRAESEAVASLRASGASIAIGHSASNLGDVDVVVFTGAIDPANPEHLSAGERGIPRLHRSQALAWLTGNGRLVAVAGAHGKTTSTGMIVAALAAIGRSPSFVNGSPIASLGASAGLGDPALWVIEADESDGSFLLYDPAIALVTNVDADHLDHYGTQAAFEAAFVRFARGASETLVISADDPGAIRVAAAVDGPRIVTFGESGDADVRVTGIGETGPVASTIVADGVSHAVRLRVPGRHNAVNAAGAFAVLRALGVEATDAVRGLEAFAGTSRRFESHGVVAGVRLFDDYAHHPAEVAAALAQARSVAGGGRIIALHQPHLYSRTRLMAPAFAEAYEAGADHTIVLDVYGAREAPIPGVTGRLVADAFIDPSRVDYLPDWQAAADRAAELASPGDLVMTLAPGDLFRIIPLIAESLRSRA